MDIGYYCLASANLLESRVNAYSIVVMDYGDFSVTLQKISNSVLVSEIQGEAGLLVIEKLSECQMPESVFFSTLMQALTQP